jgi:hypothetical protein
MERNTKDAVYRDGRWLVIRRVVEALSAAEIATKTDTWGYSGVYSVWVAPKDHAKALEVVKNLDIHPVGPGVTHGGYKHPEAK